MFGFLALVHGGGGGHAAPDDLNHLSLAWDHHVCDQIHHIHCSQVHLHTDGPVCGTDGVTYHSQYVLTILYFVRFWSLTPFSRIIWKGIALTYYYIHLY